MWFHCCKVSYRLSKDNRKGTKCVFALGGARSFRSLLSKLGCYIFFVKAIIWILSIQSLWNAFCINQCGIFYWQKIFFWNWRIIFQCHEPFFWTLDHCSIFSLLPLTTELHKRFRYCMWLVSMPMLLYHLIRY